MRRKSLAGYLGEDTPQHFIAMIHSDAPMPCHMTVDYDDPDWRSKLDQTAHQCSGQAVYLSNVSKRPRPGGAETLPVDRDNVFASPQEFFAHHIGGYKTNMAPGQEPYTAEETVRLNVLVGVAARADETIPRDGLEASSYIGRRIQDKDQHRAKDRRGSIVAIEGDKFVVDWDNGRQTKVQRKYVNNRNTQRGYRFIPHRVK